MMRATEIKTKSVAIVKFGSSGFDSDGMRPGEYFQVTIDPAMTSGDFIRFGQNPGDELVGWQRIGALTVVQILGEWDDGIPPNMVLGGNTITMMIAGGE